MARTWTRFERVNRPEPPQHLSAEDKTKWREYIESGLIEPWVNNLYHVLVYRGELVPIIPELRSQKPVWLSISRLERNKLPRDWRDLQRIKNEIVGHRTELVELFPSEDRLIDESNQTHLWGFEAAGTMFPFGYADRRVEGTDVSAAVGVDQRPFEFEPGDWHFPPASDRRLALYDEEVEFLLDTIENGVANDKDHARVADIRAALTRVYPEQEPERL